LLESIVALSSPSTVTLFSYAVRNAEQEGLYFKDKVETHFNIEPLPLSPSLTAKTTSSMEGKKPQEHRLLRFHRK
jgi:hypothetical protein